MRLSIGTGIASVVETGVATGVATGVETGVASGVDSCHLILLLAAVGWVCAVVQRGDKLALPGRYN